MWKIILSFTVLCSASLTNFSEEQSVTLFGVFGAIIGVLYHADFIKETKLRGVSVALGAIVVWILAVQAGFQYFQMHYRTSSFLATFGGLMVFGFANWLMENQKNLASTGRGLVLAWLIKFFNVSKEYEQIEKTLDQDASGKE